MPIVTLVIMLACPLGIADDKKTPDFTVLYLPNGSPIPTMKVGTVYSTSHFSIDGKGQLRNDKGAAIDDREYEKVFGALAIEDKTTTNKSSLVIAIQVNEPDKTSIAQMQSIILRIRKSVPTDRPIFVCVCTEP